jgi:hypothetical protein
MKTRIELKDNNITSVSLNSRIPAAGGESSSTIFEESAKNIIPERRRVCPSCLLKITT